MDRWQITQTGSASVLPAASSITLTVHPTPANRYSNAQVDDYKNIGFKWRAPLRMTVRARAVGDLRGTAGFGFWNHPFAPGERSLRLPRAVWFFFGSPPNNMQLAKDIPGAGWKAATFDAMRWQFLALLPAAPVGILLMRIPALYQRLWSIGQRALGVSEYSLNTSLLSQSHEYTLEWYQKHVRFSVDSVLVHEAPTAPRGRLGFVAWIDNQYSIVTPQGNFGGDVLEITQAQSLMLESISIDNLPHP